MKLQDYQSCAWSAYLSAKRQAVKRGIEFTLTEHEMGSIIHASAGYCMVSGWPFVVYELGKDQLRRPWAPSLDRINSAKGYSYGNCRLVCVAANLAMNEWGFEVLYKLAHGVMKSVRTEPVGNQRRRVIRLGNGERRFASTFEKADDTVRDLSDGGLDQIKCSLLQALQVIENME